MADLSTKRPHILFRLADTGGGHRSATEAIIEALQLEFGDRITTQMVDIFLDIAPQPLSSLPKWYPYMVRFPDVRTTHALWYHKGVDLCLVPTEAAYQRGLLSGLEAEQLKIVGLPVANRFCQPNGDKNILRQQLGWPQDRPVGLLVGGGGGRGALEKTAEAIADADPPVTLVIIAGGNEELKA